MDKDAIERMKKLIEKKKQTSSKQGFGKKSEKMKAGGNSKAIKTKKGGGLFDM
jgi:hypothetical protein